MHWYWLVCGVLLILSEFIVPGLFICFYGIAAVLVGGLICLFPGLALVWQLLIFVVIGTAAALLCRRLVPGGALNKGAAPGTDLDEDDIAGEVCRCKEPIAPGKPGKVEFRGSFWNAAADESIAAGELCVIDARENLKLIVHRK